MISMRPCPTCGVEVIRSDVAQCSVCEIAERIEKERGGEILALKSALREAEKALEMWEGATAHLTEPNENGGLKEFHGLTSIRSALAKIRALGLTGGGEG